MAKTDRIVANYLKQVGVRRYPSFETFTKYLQRRYGKNDAENLLDAVDRRGQGEDVDIYPLLYASLDLSVDFLGFESDLHSNYLQWFLDEYSESFNKPSRVLDIGCGNGVLTCFYARHFSESEVIGIDSSAEALVCAEELSRRLGLTNVRFMNLSFLDSSLGQISGRFDLIAAIKALGTAIELPEFDVTVPLRSLLRSYTDSAQVESLDNISELLGSEGTLVSMDRWSGVRSFMWWACALNNAGFAIEFSKSSRVEYFSVAAEKSKRIQVLWSRKSESGCNQVEDAIAFWLHSRYAERLNKLRTLDFQHDLAEAAFASINPKTFRFGIKGVNEELGTRWMEIWQASPFLLVYQFSTNGDRQLEVLPSIFYRDSEDHMRDLCKRAPEGTSVSTYDVPEFNWE